MHVTEDAVFFDRILFFSYMAECKKRGRDIVNFIMFSFVVIRFFILFAEK